MSRRTPKPEPPFRRRGGRGPGRRPSVSFIPSSSDVADSTACFRRSRRPTAQSEGGGGCRHTLAPDDKNYFGAAEGRTCFHRPSGSDSAPPLSIGCRPEGAREAGLTRRLHARRRAALRGAGQRVREAVLDSGSAAFERVRVGHAVCGTRARDGVDSKRFAAH
jgi:hypothetical protein